MYHWQVHKCCLSVLPHGTRVETKISRFEADFFRVYVDAGAITIPTHIGVAPQTF